MFAWLIRCSFVEKPGDMLQILPLPYDFELDENIGVSDTDLFEQGKLIRMPGVNYG